MLELRFPAGKPPSARLVLSPLWEALASVRVLQTKPIAEPYRGWADGISRRLDRQRRRLTMLFSLVEAGSAYTPGFLFVPPMTPVPDLAADLAGLRSTPTALVRADLDLLSWVLSTRGAAGVPAGPPPRAGALPEPLRDLYADPSAGLVELTRQFELYWELAIAPRWGRIKALLAADLVERGRTPQTLLRDLHPGVSWHGRSLQVEHSGLDSTRALDGTELLLMPSTFGTEPWAVALPPHHPRITYPARDLTTFLQRSEPAPLTELSGVLGTSRARLLAELELPASTSELAARTDITPGGASQHLAVLRAAGLVSSHRSGHSVLYARTATAEALIANASTPQG